jgi:hypothetical protein
MLGHGAPRPRSEAWRTYSEGLGFVSSKMSSSAIDTHLRMLCSSSTGASAICVDRGELR